MREHLSGIGIFIWLFVALLTVFGVIPTPGLGSLIFYWVW